MPSIKNWDNNTWLSSTEYIHSFNNFLIKNIKLNSNSNILDIGCGRGKILGSLNSRLKLKKKPLGIDLINHKEKDKRISFKKIDAISFFSNNKNKYDLILIKQTIHLLSFSKIKTLMSLCKKNLNPNGKIFIFTLETTNNELPTFKLMKSKLSKSLLRDKKIFKLITKIYPFNIKKKFIYKVKIDKKKYLSMIKNRYISTLLSLTRGEILKGMSEIEVKYKNKIQFKDKLNCILL